MIQAQMQDVGVVDPIAPFPAGASLQCATPLALGFVRAHAQDPNQPFAFCGHMGHLIYGSGFSRRMEAVRFDQGEIPLVQSLCGVAFASLSVGRCESDCDELARRMALVRERVLAQQFEWWRVGDILFPAICGESTNFDWVAVAPATSCLPRERFVYVLEWWCRGHALYCK